MHLNNNRGADTDPGLALAVWLSCCQVLGHTKTILVLLMGWLYWHDHMSARKLAGMGCAVVGMAGYGWFSSGAGRSSGISSRSSGSLGSMVTGLGALTQKGSSTGNLEKSGLINGVWEGQPYGGRLKGNADVDMLAHVVESGEGRGVPSARGYSS